MTRTTKKKQEFFISPIIPKSGLFFNFREIRSFLRNLPVLSVQKTSFDKKLPLIENEGVCP
jgi:hypothetical protein